MKEDWENWLKRKQEQNPFLFSIILSILVSVPTSAIVTLIAKRLLKS